MSHPRAAIAVDIGGTNIRAALVDDAGTLRFRESRPTPRSRDQILQVVQGLIDHVIGKSRKARVVTVGIGVSTGGRVDVGRGIVLDATDAIPAWGGTALGELLTGEFHLPVRVENDGRCAALAEACFGKGRGAKDFVAIAVGTGVGGGVFSDGRLLRGAKGFAGEIGHISVDAGGPVCSCGGRGCVELYSSGSGIVRWAKELYRDPHHELGIESGSLTVELIGAAARRGNGKAIRLLREAGFRLGLCAAGLINLLNPEKVILSGSLLKLGFLYLDALHGAAACAMRPNRDEVEIVPSDFPDDAGLLGAASLALAAK